MVWIDAKKPSQWEKTIYDQLNEAWRSSEGIGDYFIEDTKVIEGSNDNQKVVIQSQNQTDLNSTNDEAIQKFQRKIDSIKRLRENAEIQNLQRKIDSIKASKADVIIENRN